MHNAFIHTDTLEEGCYWPESFITFARMDSPLRELFFIVRFTLPSVWRVMPFHIDATIEAYKTVMIIIIFNKPRRGVRFQVTPEPQIRTIETGLERAMRKSYAIRSADTTA